MKETTYFRYSWEWESRKRFLELPFPMSEYQRRADHIRAEMQKDELDGILILGDVRERGNIRYLTNFYALLGHSIVILPIADDPILVTSAAAHGEPMHSFVYETWVRDIRGALFHDLPPNPPTIWQQVHEALSTKRLTRGRLGIVGSQLLGYDFAGAKQTLPDVEWIEWLRPYELVKAVKSPMELQVYECAGKAVDAAFIAALGASKPGATELDVAGVLEYEMRKNGIETVAYLFDTRVCSGPRSALKNGNPTSRRLERGDMLFMDISATYHGYALDTATCTVVDAEPSREQLPLLETAAKMTEALSAASKSGAGIPYLVELVRAVAEAEGQRDNFIEYMIGHGLGCSQLEIPHCHPNSDDVLSEGMVYALEPMVVDPLHGTGTVERICGVGANCGHLFTNLPLRPWTMAW